MKKAFYRSGEQLSVAGAGQMEGRQKLSALRQQGITACPKGGCAKYEKGYEVVLNLTNAADANLVRYIREGKAGQHQERLLEHGLVRFSFPPDQCSGHRTDWAEPVYIVGQRKTNHDEWHSRYRQGSEALVKATTRKQEMEG